MLFCQREDIVSSTNNQLVIAVSSRALFDLERENRIFETGGIAAYRTYQEAHREEPLAPGVAFPFIRRLLKINERFHDAEPFRVVVLSRNSPETGERFFASCLYHNLSIRAGAFTSGRSVLPYLKSFDVSLFLSADAEDVQTAVGAGEPAGLILPGSSAETDDENDDELRIAFDFDGVIIDDEAEREYRKDGLAGFQELEVAKSDTPHAPGPLAEFFRKLARFQDIETRRGQTDTDYRPALRVAIVTSRGAPSETRLITTLKAQGITAAELFLMDGLSKDRVLNVLKPHIFFDDQLVHLKRTVTTIPSVLVPFGVTNRQSR